MTKKAIIVISLVSEASEVSNSQIEREILKDTQIPWFREIEKVKVEWGESFMVKGKLREVQNMDLTEARFRIIVSMLQIDKCLAKRVKAYLE